MKQVSEGEIANRKSQVKSSLSLVQRAGARGYGAQVASCTSVSCTLTYGGGNLHGKEVPSAKSNSLYEGTAGVAAIPLNQHSAAGGWVHRPGRATWEGVNSIGCNRCHAGCLVEDGIGSRREVKGTSWRGRSFCCTLKNSLGGS